jgi:hypothetical protein
MGEVPIGLWPSLNESNLRSHQIVKPDDIAYFLHIFRQINGIASNDFATFHQNQLECRIYKPKNREGICK